MAYIYKKTIGNKPYYYLRISKRVEDRVIAKDIAYLGSDINQINAKLDKLPVKYKDEIRKAYKNIKRFIDSNYYLEKVGKLKENDYINYETLKEIEAIKLHFNENFQKIDSKTKENTYKNFLVDFAFNTTSIEGNTITLEEANKLLRDNLTPKEKFPREIFDLQNTQKVFFYLLEEKPKFDQELVIKIHDMLMANIDERLGYRTHDIKVFKSRFEASPIKYIKTDMNLLFKWYNKYKKKLHPLVLAALFHQKFEKIHPFADGNGRTGRMVMNYILNVNDYPPLIVKKKNRSEYLRTLSEADKSDLNIIDAKYFKRSLKYLGKEFIETYWNNFNI
jgi:Fic family protein